LTVCRVVLDCRNSNFRISKPGYDVSDGNIDHMMMVDGIILSQPLMSMAISSLPLTGGSTYSLSIRHGLGYVPCFTWSFPGASGSMSGAGLSFSIDGSNFNFWATTLATYPPASIAFLPSGGYMQLMVFRNRWM